MSESQSQLPADPRVKSLIGPLAAVALYVFFVVIALWIFVTRINWYRPQVVAHVHVLAIAGLFALLPLAAVSNELGKRVSTWLVAVFVMFQGLAVCGSLISNRFVYQNVSWQMVWNNSEIILDFVSPWILVPALILMAVAAYWVGSSAVVVLNLRNRLGCKILVLVGVVVTLWGVRHATPSRYAREPILNLLGYPGFGALESSFATRVEQEQGFSRSYRPGQVNQPRNVIVLMADSLNPSHFSMFGYHRETTPRLSAILQSVPHSAKWIGRSTGSDSACGVISTLSSRDNLDFASSRSLKLSDVLRQHGYQVNMILVGDHQYDLLLDRFLADSADFRHDQHTTSKPINSDDMVLEGLNNIPNYDGKPHFFFIFYLSSHQSGEKRTEYWRYHPVMEEILKYRLERKISADEQLRLSNLYDNKLLQLDHYIGESWTILKSKGYLDDALVVFMGDHGECVGEHGFYGHAMQLYEPFVRIPVVMMSTAPLLPKAENRFVRQIDVAPTILENLGIPVPSFWNGVSLFAPQGPQHAFHEFGVYYRVAGIDYEAMIERSDGIQWKYIRRREAKAITERYLFNLSQDPEEQHNLIATKSVETITRWDEKLDRHRSDHGPSTL